MLYAVLVQNAGDALHPVGDKVLVEQLDAQAVEIGGVEEDKAREALRLAIHKLPIKCKIVSKAEAEELYKEIINSDGIGDDDGNLD